MLNIGSVSTKTGISKTAFVSLYKEFGEKYPYTHKELVVCSGGSGSSGGTENSLNHFQIALLLIEHELGELNLTWEGWDAYVSLIDKPIMYIPSMFLDDDCDRSVGWVKKETHKRSGNSANDCSHTTNTAIDSLHQITWMN